MNSLAKVRSRVTTKNIPEEVFNIYEYFCEMCDVTAEQNASKCQYF